MTCPTYLHPIPQLYFVPEDINIFLYNKVDFNDFLPSLKEKDEFLIPQGADVISGQTNGITLHLDSEAYDHGYTPSAGNLL